MDRRFIRDAASPGLVHLLEGLERVSDRLSVGGPIPPAEPAARPGVSPHSPLLPELGEDVDDLLAELVRVAAGATRTASPGWMGHMDPPPTWSSVLGAAAGALLNNNLLMPEMSPSLTRLEEEVTRGFASEFGLGPAARGTLTSGGSLANLLALAVARARGLARLGREGMDHGTALGRLTVVGSEAAHASVARGTRLLGLDPARGLLPLPPRPDGRLDPAAVDREIRHASRDGRVCFALVATAGTTVLGAVDPLRDLADVANAHDLWYHVDAAYGGALALSRHRRNVLVGVEAADSVTVNPQKWLYVAKVCSLVLFRTSRGRMV